MKAVKSHKVLAGSPENVGDTEILFKLIRDHVPRFCSWQCCGQQGEVQEIFICL